MVRCWKILDFASQQLELQPIPLEDVIASTGITYYYVSSWEFDTED